VRERWRHLAIDPQARAGLRPISLWQLYGPAVRHVSKLYAAAAYFCPGMRSTRSSTVYDALFLAVGLAFFAAACLYLFACDRL